MGERRTRQERRKKWGKARTVRREWEERETDRQAAHFEKALKWD